MSVIEIGRLLRENNRRMVETTTFGQLGSIEDEQRAANLYFQGEVIGIQFITPGLLVNANSPAAVRSLNAVKAVNVEGEAKQKVLNKTVTIMVDDVNRITPLIDFSRIDSRLHSVLKNQDEFSERVAGSSLVRLPIHADRAQVNEVELHPGVVDKQNSTIQFLYLGDKHPGQSFINKLYGLPNSLPAVTSMNYHGEGTINDIGVARIFCKTEKIPYLIEDPYAKSGQYPIIDSYAILNISEGGIQIARKGNQFNLSVIRKWPENWKDLAPIDSNS